MAAEPVYEPIEVIGFVDDVTDGVARVLIGEESEEWFYPLTLLPDGTSEGCRIQFHYEDGRYEPTSQAADRLSSIGQRLSRPISAQRTARTELRALRQEIGE